MTLLEENFTTPHQILNNNHVHVNNVSEEIPGNHTASYLFSTSDCIGLAIAAAGVVMNGFVLFVMLLYKENRQSTTNILIINQTIGDLLCCMSQAVGYALSMANYYFDNNSVGNFWCYLLSKGAIITRITVAVIMVDLVMLTLDRYVKTLHPIFYRNHYKRWMLVAMIAISWIYGLILSIPPNIVTTVITKGQCLVRSKWRSISARVIYSTVLFLSTYVIPVTVFSFCYSRIAGRISASGVSSTKPEEQISTVAKKNGKKERNAISTMILICSTMTFCWLPTQICVFLQNTDTSITMPGVILDLTRTLSNASQCIHPFLYALRYDTVKCSVRKLVSSGMMRVRPGWSTTEQRS